MRSKSDFQFLFEIVNAYATFPKGTVAHQIAVQLGVGANAVDDQFVQRRAHAVQRRLAVVARCHTGVSPIGGSNSG